MTTLLNILINMLLAALGLQQEEVKSPPAPPTEISVECQTPQEDPKVYKC